MLVSNGSVDQIPAEVTQLVDQYDTILQISKGLPHEENVIMRLNCFVDPIQLTCVLIAI